MIKYFSKNFRKKGFTLIELIVVIAVLSVLVATAVPKYLNQVNESKLMKAANDAKIIEDALMLQASTDGGAIAFDESVTYTTAEFSAKGDVYDSQMKKVTLPADISLHPVDQTVVEKYVKTDNVAMENIVVDESGNVYFVNASGESVEIPPDSDLAIALIADGMPSLYYSNGFLVDGNSVYLFDVARDKEITISEYSLADGSKTRTINTGVTPNGNIFPDGIAADADNFYLAFHANVTQINGIGFTAEDYQGEYDNCYVAFDKATGSVTEKGLVGGSGYEQYFDMLLMAGGVVFVGSSSSTDGDFVSNPDGNETLYAAYFDGTQVAPRVCQMFPGTKGRAETFLPFEKVNESVLAGLVLYDDFSRATLPIEFMGMFDAYTETTIANGNGPTYGFCGFGSNSLRVVLDMENAGNIVLETVKSDGSVLDSHTMVSVYGGEMFSISHHVNGNYHYIIGAPSEFNEATFKETNGLVVVRIDSTKALSAAEYYSVPLDAPLNGNMKTVKADSNFLYVYQDEDGGSKTLIKIDLDKIEYTK